MSGRNVAPRWAIAAAAGLAAAAFAPVAPAGATGEANRADTSQQTREASGNAARSVFTGQHDGSSMHLPPRRENVDLIGKLSPTAKFGDIVPGQIADVAVHKNWAYLMSWAEDTCTRGGVYVVDISNPSAPKEGPFIPALPGLYHGEGAHALTVSTAAFSGDLLAVNNEACNDTTAGGFDLYDVSNPNEPKILVQGFGDTTTAGGVTYTNSYHSVFVWQAGSSVFLVAVDNFEFNDVDIFDITDPRSPRQVGDYDLFDMFPEIEDNLALGYTPFHHDMVVKPIGGRQIMMASYWDAGYVALDVTDPSNPTYVGDTSFDGPDPLQPSLAPPEGNAHQGEWSFDNRFFLAADEDFAPYRVEQFEVTTGPNAGNTHEAVDVGGGTSPAFLSDGVLNGPVVYGGYGCDGSDPIPQRADYTFDLDRTEEAIIVLQRGPTSDPENPEEACFPGEKARNGKAAGWDAVVLVNRHFGAAEDDHAYCGSGDFGSEIVVTTCTTHTAFHEMFNDSPNYEVPYEPGTEPAVGAEGERIRATPVFDGWGYAHLYEYGAGKMRAIDHYAIPESQDPRYSFAFGDLSIHEWATDPTEYLGYAAYYAGGFRTVTFGLDGIQEVGSFIDEGGNNFWGVEQFTAANGERLIALSDRDYGLYIVQYTGPGAARPPVCEDVDWYTQEGTATEIQLICKDPNPNNAVTVTIDRQPANGTVTLDGFKATYTPRAGFNGIDTFTYTAFDGAARSRTAQVQVFVGGCARRIDGSAARDLINGTPAGDAIFGGGGNDTIDGIQADDCIAGEDGSDSMSGGEGNDRVLGGAGRDRVFGDAGDDDLRGGLDRDHIRGSSGDDALYGEAGNDYVSGGSNNDRVSGGAGRDSIRGEAGNDRLFGGPGNDSIATGQGSDRVSAGAGNDKVDAANGRRNRIRCGKGRDRVKADRKDRVARDCERVSRLRRTRG